MCNSPLTREGTQLGKHVSVNVKKGVEGWGKKALVHGRRERERHGSGLWQLCLGPDRNRCEGERRKYVYKTMYVPLGQRLSVCGPKPSPRNEGANSIEGANSKGGVDCGGACSCRGKGERVLAGLVWAGCAARA